MNGDANAVSGGYLWSLPIGASSMSDRIDALFLAMLVLSGAVALLLLVLVVGFSIRFREGSSASRKSVLRKPRRIEIAWTVTPALIFLALFVWAAHDFTLMDRPPPDAMPVNVVAKQWMWKLQHRNGRREINELHVPLGQPVHLTMTSEDAIHSFFVPAFRVKHDVLPGRYTSLWFAPTEVGEFHLFCAEYCGSQHSQMIGRVVVMRPDDFAQWLAAGPLQPSLAQYGFALYRRLGCSGCHEPASSVHAPSLIGLLGRERHFADGTSLVADPAYIRDSLLLPRKHIVAGFEPLMPSFSGQLEEDEIAALIAYIRSTADGRAQSGRPRAVR